VFNGPFCLTGFGGAVSIKNMEKSKGNKGLLDQKRFEQWEKERKQRLRKLSPQRAIRLAEEMLATPLVDEWRKNFAEDHPVCLRMSLKRRRKS
jgi:hypothetical protein